MQHSMAEPEKFAGVLTKSTRSAVPPPAGVARQPPRPLTLLLAAGISVLVVIFISFGCMAYLAYGDATHDMVTLNLPHNAWVACVQLLYSLGLLLTYPIMMFPAIQILEDAGPLRAWLGSTAWGAARRRAFRTGLVLFTALVAVTVPQFSLFVNLIGSVSCTLLAFVLPAAFYLRLFQSELGQWAVRREWSVIAFGVVGGVVSLSITLKQLFQP